MWVGFGSSSGILSSSEEKFSGRRKFRVPSAEFMYEKLHILTPPSHHIQVSDDAIPRLYIQRVSVICLKEIARSVAASVASYLTKLWTGIQIKLSWILSGRRHWKRVRRGRIDPVVTGGKKANLTIGIRRWKELITSFLLWICMLCFYEVSMQAVLQFSLNTLVRYRGKLRNLANDCLIFVNLIHWLRYFFEVNQVNFSIEMNSYKIWPNFVEWFGILTNTRKKRRGVAFIFMKMFQEVFKM